MRVFLSWSGERSKAMADALYRILPDVIQEVEPFFSKHIAAGNRWSLDLANELKTTNVGVICLTRENLEAPWILFEAGALSKALEHSSVCPYLLDVEPSALRQPLGQFQAVKANEDGTLHILAAINRCIERPLAPERLDRCFKRCWKELKKELEAIPESTAPAPKRDVEDLLQEILANQKSQVGLLRPRTPQAIWTSRDDLLEATVAFEGGPLDGLLLLSGSPIHPGFIASSLASHKTTRAFFVFDALGSRFGVVVGTPKSHIQLAKSVPFGREGAGYYEAVKWDRTDTTLRITLEFAGEFPAAQT